MKWIKTGIALFLICCGLIIAGLTMVAIIVNLLIDNHMLWWPLIGIAAFIIVLRRIR